MYQGETPFLSQATLTQTKMSFIPWHRFLHFSDLEAFTPFAAGTGPETRPLLLFGL